MTLGLNKDWTYAVHELFQEVNTATPLSVETFESRIRALFQAKCNVTLSMQLLSMSDQPLWNRQIYNVCAQINESPPENKINILVMSTLFKNLIQTFDEDRTHYSYFYREVIPLKLKGYPYAENVLVKDWFTVATLSVLTPQEQSKMRQTFLLPPHVQEKTMPVRILIGKKILSTFSKEDLRSLIAYLSSQKGEANEKVIEIAQEYRTLASQMNDEGCDYGPKFLENLLLSLPLMEPKLPSLELPSQELPRPAESKKA